MNVTPRSKLFAVALAPILGIGLLLSSSGAAASESQYFPLGPVTPGATGPDTDSRTRADSFGQNAQATWIPSAAFTPFDSTTTYGYTGGGYRHLTAAANAPSMDGAINLPSGALLQSIRLYFLDNDGAANASLDVFRFEQANASTLLAQATSAATPGYSSVSTPAFNETISNADNTYVARVNLSPAAGANVAFMGVRLFWSRQIAPAPLAATFNDVPTSHQFFQHIEALADSGITAGCGGGNYCPDNPVTRAQMAAFLARALGLHWGFADGF